MPAVLFSFIALLAAAGSRGGSLVVDFAPASGAPWVAAAVEQAVAKEAARFSKLSVLDKRSVESEHCEGRARCLVEAYGKAGVDIVVVGELGTEGLDWQLFETWSGTEVDAGTLELAADIRSVRFEQQIGDILRPVVQSGGLIDRHVVLEDEAVATAPASRLAEPIVHGRPVPLVQAILVLLILFIAAPLMLLRGCVDRRFLAKAERATSWNGSALLVAAPVAVLLAYSLPLTRELFRRLPLSELPLAPLWVVVPVCGGMAWGWLALLNLRLVVPQIFGIDRARHDALLPLLGTWLCASAQRALLLGVYLPFALLAWWLAGLFGLTSMVLWTLVMPALGLLVHFWLLSLVDTLTLYLDQSLVQGPAGPKNPWHRAIKKYMTGYVRRTGVDLDPELLEHILFLPGKDGIATYGGGTLRPRIVLGAELRELALGALPEGSDAQEEIIDMDALPIGTILPLPSRGTTKGAARTAERAQRLREESRSRRLGIKPAGPRLIGENTTLLGWVMPQPDQGSVPLISNNTEDFSVVSSLLTEHYAAFDRSRYDEEYDDSDPGQKDFLFGLLLREIGAIMRGDNLIATFALASAKNMERATRPGRLLARAASELWLRLGSRWNAALADAFAALLGGRDQLVQYLWYAKSGREAELTARADAPELVRTTKEIFEQLGGQEPEGADRQLLCATPRNRLVWLSRFFFVQVEERHVRRIRLLAAAAGALGLAGIIALLVRQSIDYHPRYLERMRRMEEQLASSSGKEADGGQDQGH